MVNYNPQDPIACIDSIRKTTALPLNKDPVPIKVCSMQISIVIFHSKQKTLWYYDKVTSIIDTTSYRRMPLHWTMISMWMKIRKTLKTRTINRPMTSMEIMMGLQYFHFMCFMPFFCTLLHSYFEHVLIATLIATPSLTLYVRWNMDHNMFFISWILNSFLIPCLLVIF